MATDSEPFPTTMSLEIGQALENATAAITRLDGRVSATFVRLGWMRRAPVLGFTRALNLQGVEIDEIDTFIAVSDAPLPSRPKRASNAEEFAGFAAWNMTIARETGPEWRDRLPVTPRLAIRKPIIWASLETLYLHARADRSMAPWLALPFLLRGLGLTHRSLPCLVAGAKLFRVRATVSPDVLHPVLRSLAKAAEDGLQLLERMERDHRAWLRVLVSEYRQTSLARLGALSAARPFLSPQITADILGLTIGGAGKLLARAAEQGLLVEVSGRRSWRQYLSTEAAITYGFASPPRGRPPLVENSDLEHPEFSVAIDAFDREMAEIESRLARLL